MLHVAALATLVLQAPAVKPLGSPKTMGAGKNISYIAEGEGARFEVVGPTGVIFDVRAEDTKPATVNVSSGFRSDWENAQ